MNEQVCGQLTLFQEDFPVNHFLTPGSTEARKMTVTSGRKWLGLSRNCGPLGLLEKMLLESSIWHSTKCFLTWKARDTQHGHFLYQLQVLMPRSSDTGQQLWPTPKATIRGDCASERNRRSTDLAAAVKMWPTPTASDGVNKKIVNPIITKNGTIRHKNKAGGQSLMNLCQVAKLFPAPVVEGKQMEPGSGQLNPTWAEWLMGVPIGWTDLDALEIQ